MLSPSQTFRIPLARREESSSISKAPASPPPAPPLQGGDLMRMAGATPRWPPAPIRARFCNGESKPGLVKSWSAQAALSCRFRCALFPPLRRGGRGGGSGMTSHKVFPCSLPLRPFASRSRGEKNRLRFPRLPHHPPCPPFARGGFNGGPLRKGGICGVRDEPVNSGRSQIRSSRSTR